jgi:hypothetical protein
MGDWRMPMHAALMEMVGARKTLALSMCGRALNVRIGLYSSEIVSWNFV